MFGIDGLMCVPDFIDQELHDSLLRDVDKLGWGQSGSMKRRVQQFGFAYEHQAQRVGSRAAPIPPFMNGLLDRLVPADFFGRKPSQVIVNEYLPGQGIGAHIDHPSFGPVVASLSLASPVVMEFTLDDDVLCIKLEPRSLVVLKKDARYKWRHEIPARRIDTINDKQFERSRRISLTFRTVQR
jgi:alkylated DNA repair dioxygenase AlkB